jgi:hypothetical protein
MSTLPFKIIVNQGAEVHVAPGRILCKAFRKGNSMTVPLQNRLANGPYNITPT